MITIIQFLSFDENKIIGVDELQLYGIYFYSMKGSLMMSLVSVLNI